MPQISLRRPVSAAALGAAGLAVAVLLTLAAADALTGLDVLAIPFIATAGVLAMAPSAPLARPRAIALGYPASVIPALLITYLAGPSQLTAAASGAVAIALLILLKTPHVPAVAAAAYVGFTDPGPLYLLAVLLPAVLILLPFSYAAAHLLPRLAPKA
ncbi:HPP family protein [Bailinhaonella thermotolerans]|nr:HPP family protein [Bailinhaonella thermotolerans]